MQITTIMIYYKACQNSIVSLEPLIDTNNNENRNDVADPLHAKFRCDRAKVISIINPTDGKSMEEDISIYDENFIYKVGEIVSSNYDKDVNEVCTKGIHYFKTKETAVSWFYQSNDKKFFDGKRIGWHENGRKRYEKSYNDGKKDGTWTWWYDKDGEKDGKWISWYKSGSKEYEKSYKKGKKDGTWTYWYDGGSKEYERSYKDGKEDGIWIGWYENGNREYEGLYKDGKEDGIWIGWYESGNKNYEKSYNDGEKHGKWAWWYGSGNKNYDKSYNDGELIMDRVV